jgi:hypothetical protein
MKKSIFSMAFAAIIMVGIIYSCDSPTKKVEKAQENLSNAEMELDQAQKDSIQDFENFKLESEIRISDNERVIAAYRQRMLNEKNKFKVEDQKRIDEIEQRNINMRKKIAEYKAEGKDKWISFKQEFNHDMDDLGSAIKNLGVKNTN